MFITDQSDTTCTVRHTQPDPMLLSTRARVRTARGNRSKNPLGSNRPYAPHLDEQHHAFASVPKREPGTILISG